MVPSLSTKAATVREPPVPDSDRRVPVLVSTPFDAIENVLFQPPTVLDRTSVPALVVAPAASVAWPPLPLPWTVSVMSGGIVPGVSVLLPWTRIPDGPDAVPPNVSVEWLTITGFGEIWP